MWVRDWDQEVRSAFPNGGYWFAPLSSQVKGFATEYGKAGAYRHVKLRKDLIQWFDKVSLPYRSPHQFRHGHAVHGLKNSKNVADLKAVSQNLMHSSLTVTDSVYGVLSEDDRQKRISMLGNNYHDE